MSLTEKQKKRLKKWSPNTKYGGKKSGLKNVSRAATELTRDYDRTGKHDLKKFEKKVDKGFKKAGISRKKYAKGGKVSWSRYGMGE